MNKWLGESHLVVWRCFGGGLEAGVGMALRIDSGGLEMLWRWLGDGWEVVWRMLWGWFCEHNLMAWKLFGKECGSSFANRIWRTKNMDRRRTCDEVLEQSVLVTAQNKAQNKAPEQRCWNKAGTKIGQREQIFFIPYIIVCVLLTFSFTMFI